MLVVGLGVMVAQAQYILFGVGLGVTLANADNTKVGKGEGLVVGCLEDGSTWGLALESAMVGCVVVG